MSVTKTEFDARPMPSIASVRAIGDGLCIEATWASGGRAGRTEIVDLSPLINQFKFYAPLRKSEVFSTVQIADDGEILEWEGGKFDMPATHVEDLAQEQMTGSEFGDFLERNQLTRSAAAAVLGRSLRRIQDYVASKDDPIPRIVALACKGLEARNLPSTLATMQTDYNVRIDMNHGSISGNYLIVTSSMQALKSEQ
ncbi:MAG: hypothetical protein KDK08_21990 [Rhizobiaceae bacterium]|nr:hypothetical protein [Rhizobiaceae bacterium]